MIPARVDTERAETGPKPQGQRVTVGTFVPGCPVEGGGGGKQPYLLSAMLYTSAELVSPVSVTPAATKMRPSWMVAPKSERGVFMGASSLHSNFLGS